MHASIAKKEVSSPSAPLHYSPRSIRQGLSKPSWRYPELYPSAVYTWNSRPETDLFLYCRDPGSKVPPIPSHSVPIVSPDTMNPSRFPILSPAWNDISTHHPSSRRVKDRT